ncbi:Leucine Rich Repeat [Seminavis robusta]|uniref:Leucine Rich Repeat n=1 Tax=Seminavis robusta TaxID=568900 RepID=A0A9N8H460_9STRA|nr:Leucine Rich Repeat [Seminavis robusta]|eukprot:Sro105_g053250.1 Leucine Rich Repeat (717) ;mRNA; r:65278-67518
MKSTVESNDIVDPQGAASPEENSVGGEIINEELADADLEDADAAAKKVPITRRRTNSAVDPKKASSLLGQTLGTDNDGNKSSSGYGCDGCATQNPPPKDHGIMALPEMQQNNITETEELTPGAYLFEGGEFRTAVEANAHGSDDFDWEGYRNQQRTHAPVQTAPSRAVLAVANAVEEVDPLSLPQAMPSEANSDNAKRDQKDNGWVAICTCAGLALMGGLVLLIVFLVSGTDQSTATNYPAAASSMAPTSPISLESYLSSLLPNHTVKAMEDKDSPQYQAFEWLLEDPYVYGYAEKRILQRHALMSFFYATAGPTQWTNKTGWGSYSLHECDWYQNQDFASKTILQNYYPGFLQGFLEPLPDSRCDNQGIYTHLWLDQNNLVGSFVEEVFSLTSLKTLSAGLNPIYGTISSHIGHMSDLQGLAIASAGLSGSLPSEMGYLSSLQVNSLYGNQLEGTVPEEIWQLTNLEFLVLGRNNKLQGSIPSKVGTFAKLRWLLFEECDLSGPLPTELGQATSLEWLVLVAGNLSDTLPTELGSLPRLWFLSLYGNQLEGTLATELGLLSSLGVVDLRWNSFSGTLPSELGLLPVLQTLSLESNFLSGTIPTELANLSELYMLPLADNRFTGFIPSEFGMMPSLELLSVANNSLSGTIPQDLAPLQRSLYSLHVQGNSLLSGVMPDLLCAINKTCVFDWFEECEGPYGLIFECTEMLCGCDCPC